MNLERKIVFGLVGTGTIAPVHCQAIRANPHARLKGVYSSLSSRGAEFAKKFSLQHYPAYTDMLNDEEIDVVDIVTRTHLHADLASAALAHGKHVLVEKPIDVDVIKAERLASLAKAKNLVLSCVSEFRFAPGVKKLQDLLAADAFGKIFLINVSLPMHRDSQYFTSAPWRGKKNLAGGGVLAMQAIHLLDILLKLFGPVKEIRAKTLTLRADIEVEDYAAVLLQFKNNILCSLTATTQAPRGLPVAIEVHGTRRSVRLNNLVTIQDLSSNKIIYDLPISSKLRYGLKGKKLFMTDCFVRQIDDLTNALRGKAELKTTADDGVEALKLLMRIYAAAAADD